MDQKDNHVVRSSRRRFITQSSLLLSGALITNSSCKTFAGRMANKKITVSAHLWVYASAFPPKWDSTPVLEKTFSDLSYAGIEGVELMEVILRHDDAVERISKLIKKYHLPVTGTSYGADMWDASKHDEIWNDIKLVIPRLSQLKGKTFGISVGNARRIKTESELDAQAKLLKKIISFCGEHDIEPNLHNHTYEIENDMHDLKGTLKRIPEIKLGPDLNWLIRGGVDPVWFINMYGSRIVYLHIRDQYSNGIWTEWLGQGDTDFTSIAMALKAKKFNGKVAVELAFPNDFKPINPLKEDWKLSREFVKKTFGW